MRGSGEFGAFSPPSLRRPEIVPRPPRATAMPIRSALTDPEPTSRPGEMPKSPREGMVRLHSCALDTPIISARSPARLRSYHVSWDEPAMDTNHCAFPENTRSNSEFIPQSNISNVITAEHSTDPRMIIISNHNE